MSTVEVEDATDLGASFHDMVVGVINTIEQHPNADKLKVCKTDIGGRVEDIVCGGSNLREGMKVAVALPGAMCKWHGEGDLVEIKKSKLRGVDSYGMICGAVEIGLADLFPTKEEAHILDLSDFDAPRRHPFGRRSGPERYHSGDRQQVHDQPPRSVGPLRYRPGDRGAVRPAHDAVPHFDRNVENTSGFHVTVEDAERCPA